jgi:tetratricopeptide (TPR) repeat protein
MFHIRDRHKRGAAAVLLCGLLLQSCQSQLGVLQEEDRPVTPAHSRVAMTPSVPSAASTSDTLARVQDHTFTTSTDRTVTFQHVADGSWTAHVTDQRFPGHTTRKTYPVVCEAGRDPAATLGYLTQQPAATQRRYIHLRTDSLLPIAKQVVCLAYLGLRGGTRQDGQENTHVDQPSPDAARSLEETGRAYYSRGEMQEALTEFDRALKMFQALYGDQPHPDIASSLNNVGVVHTKMGEVEEGLKYQEQALEVLKALYGDQPHLDIATSLNNAGRNCEALGEIQKGLTYYKQALSMRETLYEDQLHPDLARSLNNVGIAYQELGYVQKGLEYHEKALKMCETLYEDQSHPDTAMSLNSMGRAYYGLGKMQEALTYFNKALKVFQALYGDQPHPDLASCLHNVGVAYEKLGDAQQAMEYSKQALEMRKTLYGNQPHSEIAISLYNVGEAYKKLGDAQKSLTYCEQALEMQKALYGDQPHPDVAGSLNSVGVAYEKLGDAQKSLTYFKQALEMHKALHGDLPHPEIASSLNNMGGMPDDKDEKPSAKKLRTTTQDKEPPIGATILNALLVDENDVPTIPMSVSVNESYPPRLRDYIPQRNVRDDDYVERTEATKKVQEFLEQEGICVVCGPGGSGKSTLAMHDAADASERDDRQVTRFVPADSREKFIAGLQYVAQELGIDCQFLAEIFREAPGQYCQELYNAIYNALEKSGQYLCLILDNAQDVDWVRDCASRKDKKRIQIIVTTRDPMAFSDYRSVLVKLTGFSATEAEAYVAKRLEPIKDRYQPDEQAIKKLIATVGSSPLGLELATGYLLTNSLSTVETYLEALRSAAPESGVIPQVDMGLADLADPLSQQVMRYSTWLDADFIPVSLLKAILEKESLGALQEILTPLETLSLVTVSTNKQGTDQGIRIHQDVQKSCAHYRGWVEGAHISESDLLSRLSSALTQVLDASSTPNEGEEARQKYLQHVTSVLASAMQSSAFAKDKKEVVSQWVPLLIAYAGPKWEAQKTSVVWDALLPHGQALFDAIDTKDSFQEKERYQLARYLAYACHVTARFEEGNKWAEECLCIARENHGHQNHPSVAHALRSVGISLVELGRHEEALQYKLEALEMHKRLDEEGEADKEDVARAWSDVASSYSQLGRREEALACQRVVLAMRERLWPAGKHPEIAHTLNSIGELLSHLEKYEEALEFKEKALKMRRELFNDKDHPDIRRSLASVGIGYEQMGDLNKAREYKEKALEMSRRLHKDRKHPDIAHSLNNLGETLIEQGQLEEGLGKLEEALAMRKEIYGKDRPHHYTAQSLNSVGRALALLSERTLKEASELLTSARVPDTPTTASLSHAAALPLTTTPRPAASEMIQPSEGLFASHIAAPEAEEDCKPAARPTPLVSHRNETPEERRNRTEIASIAQSLRRLVSALSLKHTPEDADKVAAVLSQLAALHQKQGRETGELSHYTDAATCYQHALHVWAKEQASDYDVQIKKTYEGLAQIKASMIASIKGPGASSNALTPEALREEITRDKQELESLRGEAKQKLTEIDKAEQNDKAEYIEKSRVLFADIAERIGTFLGRLYEESERELGPAPCKYTVLGLGSMALQHMTPYSDLEFAILMEDSDDKEILDKRRDYFRQLSHLVHLRVINLGETVLPMSKYGVILDRLSKRGLNFDLGGKTPLGRPDKDYDLIQPVAGMMDYLRNEGNKSTRQDKLLPFILERTCYVHGDEGLHAAYARASKEFLKEGKTERGIPVYQEKALAKLLPALHASEEGTANPREQGDLAKFKAQFDMGRLYDVKQEIYRLPDRLLYGLAMYYGLLPESGWNAVDQLRSQEVISAAAVSHLQYAVSFATLLRLRTYLHYGQQKEVMGVRGVSPTEIQEAVGQSFSLPPVALQEGGSLFQYYYTAIPLHKKMEEFFTLKEIIEDESPMPNRVMDKILGLKKGDASFDNEASFFQKESFYDEDDGIKGRIFGRLMQHEEVLRCYKEAVKKHKKAHGDDAHPDLAIFLYNVGVAYQDLGEAQNSLTYSEQALEMQKSLYQDEPHSYTAHLLNGMGVAYETLGKSKEALKYYEQALEMRKALYGNQPHFDIAHSLNSVGGAHDTLGYMQEALTYYKQALEMRKALYGNQPHPNTANSLNNVGVAYQKLGYAQEGLKYYEQALEMRKTLYGDQPHPCTAESLNNMGAAYEGLGKEKEGLTYFEQALEMRKALYGNQSHPAVAISLNNVGVAYGELGNPQESLMYYKQALKMRKALYGDQPHPDIATSLNNVGVAYNNLGGAQRSLTYFEQALEMRKALYGNQPHPAVATSLNGLGGAYKELGDAQQALEYYKQALEMQKTLYGDRPHPDIADSLNNVGEAYHERADAQKSLTYCEQALNMQKTLYGDRPHPAIANSLYNLGEAYSTLENAQRAMACHKQALEMRKVLYGEGNHPEVAGSLNSVGNAYYALGNTKKGLTYFEEALTMSQALYGDQPHPDIASSLNNVGVAHRELGNALESLMYFAQALEMRKALYGNQPHP